MPFNVLFREVADADLGPLLTRAADLGYASPSVSPVAGGHEHQLNGNTEPVNDLVAGWQLVDRREGQVYQWPETLDHYDRYEVYRGEMQAKGAVFISLGWTVRRGAWGADRVLCRELPVSAGAANAAGGVPGGRRLCGDRRADRRDPGQ